MKHIVSAVQKNVGREVKFASDCMGDDTKKMAAALKPGEGIMHTQITIHITGDKTLLNKASVSSFGVSLEEIENVFK
jgi:3-phosphoglycerate kinase